MNREQELREELQAITKANHNEVCRVSAENKRRDSGIAPRRVGIDLERRKEMTKIRDKSLIGKLKRVYNSQLRNSRSRGHVAPTYTLDEFVAMYIDNPKYVELHTEWVKSDYEKSLAPSFDRLEDDKGYSFDNLQVVTWKRNNTKAHEDMKDGKLINAHKTIYQYKDGVTTEYKSSVDAERATGISRKAITNVVNGNAKKTRDGSLWTRSVEGILDAQIANSEVHGSAKTVLQYNTENELIAEHRSTKEAADSAGLKSSSNIRAACDGRRKTAGGFVWKYKT